jgi:hypothetical protein
MHSGLEPCVSSSVQCGNLNVGSRGGAAATAAAACARCCSQAGEAQLVTATA